MVRRSLYRLLSLVFEVHGWIALLLYLHPLPSFAEGLVHDPILALEQQEQELFRLYSSGPAYNTVLERYAISQGFRLPFEKLGTVIHERIHIASASRDGYFIDGVYYEPYMRSDAWPKLNNSNVAPFFLPHERGIIYSGYVTNTGKNTMANVIDELNAYGHVAGFICKNEPSSAPKQVRNIVGMLHLLEVYFRVLRIAHPEDYKALLFRRESRGAIQTITERAWSALGRCGVVESAIPKKETAFFLALPVR